MSVTRFLSTSGLRPTGKWVGVFLSWEAKYQCWHVGLIYTGQNDSIYLLHLVGHNDLKAEIPKGREIYIQLQIPSERLFAITAYLRRIHKNHSKIPYGFSALEHEWFNPNTGGCRATLCGDGLTCTTFVLAALQGARFPLINTATWPVRADDEDKKDKWISRLRPLRSELTPKGQEHFDAVVKLPCLVRVRLLELLGAAADSKLPSPYERANAIGLELRPEIQKHFTHPPP
jgi:hypothetical protein